MSNGSCQRTNIDLLLMLLSWIVSKKQTNIWMHLVSDSRSRDSVLLQVWHLWGVAVSEVHLLRLWTQPVQNTRGKTSIKNQSQLFDKSKWGRSKINVNYLELWHTRLCLMRSLAKINDGDAMSCKLFSSAWSAKKCENTVKSLLYGDHIGWLYKF